METQKIITIPCPECKNPIDSNVFYCPVCGKKIKDKPLAMDFWHLAWLFFLSILLPPLNLPLTFKYMKSSNKQAKQIGWYSLLAMVLAITIGMWYAVRWAQHVNDQVNEEMSKYLRGY